MSLDGPEFVEISDQNMESESKEEPELAKREIFLVSDDAPMREKASRYQITSISSRFMFILCNELGNDLSTN